MLEILQVLAMGAIGGGLTTMVLRSLFKTQDRKDAEFWENTAKSWEGTANTWRDLYFLTKARREQNDVDQPEDRPRLH